MVDFNEIAEKWQKKWAETKLFQVKSSKLKSFYCLEMFPYPSGYLHMGHVRNYSLGDVEARYRRMKGLNVLYPMGYDAFGLPAENAAIKHKVNPKEWTKKNIEGIKNQQKLCGFSYDWSREISTCDPEYYKWNQWLFLKFFEKGLAYKKEAPVNWCSKCDTVLANEQVNEGKCWRCDTVVEDKLLSQWFFKITDYADELLEDIEKLDQWPEKVKIMQKNWIGKSNGTEIFFKVKEMDMTISTFTTRPDTIYGVTYLVFAPEHPTVLKLIENTKHEKDVKKFIAEVKQKPIFERTAEGKEKNGMFIGRYFINPVTGDECPIYVADYALADYGTGAVMAVPAHDQRDFDFAKKYGLPIKVVIKPQNYELDPEKMSRAYVEDGFLVNSDKFDDMHNKEAIVEISKYLEKKEWGKITVNYKLKDWLISRQRYWGTPIPMINCEKCGLVPVHEKDLPIKLPEDVKFSSKGNPLETSSSFKNVKCPKCNEKAVRETDTMDTFVDSSWYFLRYCDSKNEKKIFDFKKTNSWIPVDKYIGGIEHAVMHLLYARFLTKALRDLKLLEIDEPFKELFTLGMVTKDGAKMSKSLGNVVDPIEIIEQYGPDTIRLFILFTALPEKELEWNDAGVVAMFKFLNKVYGLVEKLDVAGVDIVKSKEKFIESRLNSVIKQITEDIEDFRLNFAIREIMSLVNDLQKYHEKINKNLFKDCVKKIALILSPFAPHVCEEIWSLTGEKSFVSISKWPEYDSKKIDEKAEYFEDMLENTLADIVYVKDLRGFDKIKKIKIYVAEDWKYDFINQFKEVWKDTKNVGEIIKICVNKEHGKEISKLVPMLVKNPVKLPKVSLTLKEELKVYEDNLKFIEDKFSSKVELLKAKDADETKAKQALPGKPAIILKSV